jgi:SP family myo-inositol transporter-like MFS transporter 13
LQVEDPDGLINGDGSTTDGGPSEDYFSGGEVKEPVPEEPLSVGANGSVQFTPMLALLVLVAAAGGFLFGYDTSAIGGALLFINEELRMANLPPLSATMMGIIPAATPLGAVFGALSGGFWADRYGRRPAVMLAGVIFTLGAAIMAFSVGSIMLIVGRLVVGLGVGLVSMVVPVYLAESAPESIRGAIVTLNILFVTGGQFFAYCCNVFLKDVPYQWRWLLGISAVPAIMQFIGMMFLHETPRWLVSQGLLADAKRALTAVRGDAAVAAREVREICIAVKNEPRGTLRELVFDWTNRRALLLACGVLVLQQACAINTVMYYVPTILTDSLPTGNVPLWSLLPAGTNALGTVVGLLLVDRIGRRLLLLASISGVAVTLLGFGLVAQFNKPLEVWALVLYLLAFAPGLGPVPWAVSSEIFSVKVRGLGTSISTAANWLSNFVISITFPIIVAAVGLPATFFGYAVLAVASYFFVFFLLPETKGLTLEEVQTMLRDNPYPTRFCTRRRLKVRV